MKGYLYKKVLMLWPLLVFLMTLGFPPVVYGQLADSLISAHTDKNGTVNIKALIDATKTQLYSHPTETFSVAKKTLSFAEKDNRPKTVKQACQLMGLCYIHI